MSLLDRFKRRRRSSRPLCDWCGKKAVTVAFRTLYVDTEYEHTSKYFECRKCARKPTTAL